MEDLVVKCVFRKYLNWTAPHFKNCYSLFTFQLSTQKLAQLLGIFKEHVCYSQLSHGRIHACEPSESNFKMRKVAGWCAGKLKFFCTLVQGCSLFFSI